MPRLIQPSFARGEIGPDLYGRVDVAAYAVALRTALNATVHSFGGVSNRAGLRFVGPCSTHTGTPPRLIEFRYNAQDTYILEFGEGYMRAVRNDAHVLKGAKGITAATQADPVVITSASHGLSNGEDVYVVGAAGMTELNGRWFTVANRTANTIQLTSQQTGANIDGSAYGAYSSAGSVAGVFELSTPYAADDTIEIKYVQSANVMTLVHPSHAPRELSRTTASHTSWSLEVITFAPKQVPPSGVVITPVVAGTSTFNYQLTASNDETGEESLPVFKSVTLAAIPPDNSIVFTPAPGATRHSIYRQDNGIYGWIGDTDTISFRDENIAVDAEITPPKSRNPFAGAGNFPAAVSYYEQRRVLGRTNNAPDTNWYSVTGSQANMSHSSPRQADDAITATLNSLEVNEIRHYVPGNDLLTFTSGSEWRVNAGQESAFSAETLRQKPQSYWGSAHLRPLVIGDKTLFVTENSSYVRSLGYQFNVDGYPSSDMTIFSPHIFREHIAVDWAKSSSPDPVVDVVRADGYVASMTFNPEQEVVAWTRWKTDGKFRRVASTKPNAASIDVASYFVVDRVVEGTPARYIERVASRRFEDVRDCFFVDSGLSLDNPFTISNVTATYPPVVTAPAHTFKEGEEIDVADVRWEPDVDEFFNGTQPDQLNGRRYYVAEADANTFQLVRNDGRVDISGVTQANPAMVTAAAHGLADGDVIGVFNTLGMVELNGNTYKVANAATGAFELSTLADAPVDSTGFTAYTVGGQVYPAEDGSTFSRYDEGGSARKAVSGIGGLWHLEGREIVILADGDVVSGLVVSGGAVTLPRKYSRVHAGLRYITDIGTLNPEAPRGTVQGKRMRIPYATMRFKDTRGLFIGGDETDLVEMKQREFENMGAPTELLTGDKTVEFFSDWDGGGRILLRQVNPLPLTLTALVPFLEVGDTDE